MEKENIFTPKTPEDPNKAVEEMIRFCISNNEDPFEYSLKNNINLTDKAIQEAIRVFRSKTYEEDSVLLELSRKITRCCEGVKCSYNLCPAKNLREMTRKSEGKSTTFEHMFNLLIKVENTPEANIEKRRFNINHIVYDLIKKAQTEEELTLLLEHLPEIRNEYMRYPDAMEQPDRNMTAEQYVDSEISFLKEDIEEKLELLKNNQDTESNSG